MSIWKFLGFGDDAPAGASGDIDTVRKITTALEQLPPERARYIAQFAYILSRVANADLEISEVETRTMERLVREHGGLPEEQAVLVVHIAKSQNVLFGGTENFTVTTEFARTATHEQKVALLHCLFAVSAADQSISSREDHTIRQIARELGIEHPEYIALRMSHREFLAVLKDPNAAE